MLSKESEEKLNKLFVFFAIVIFGSIILISIFQGKINKKEMETNYKYTKARIIDFEEVVYKNSTPTRYRYTVDNIKYTSPLPSEKICKVLEESDKELIKQVEFDVVYYTYNPQVSELLHTPKEYAKFNLEYPINDTTKIRILTEYFDCKWSFWRWIN